MPFSLSFAIPHPPNFSSVNQHKKWAIRIERPSFYFTGIWLTSSLSSEPAAAWPSPQALPETSISSEVSWHSRSAS